MRHLRYIDAPPPLARSFHHELALLPGWGSRRRAEDPGRAGFSRPPFKFLAVRQTELGCIKIQTGPSRQLHASFGKFLYFLCVSSIFRPQFARPSPKQWPHSNQRYKQKRGQVKSLVGNRRRYSPAWVCFLVPYDEASDSARNAEYGAGCGVS